MTKPVSEWVLPRNVVFGRGSIEALPEKLALQGVKNPILVTDPGIAETSILKSVGDLLANAGFSFAVFSDVVPEPPVSCLEAALAAAKEMDHCDGVIGVGGGSAMDVAKSLAILLRYGGRIQDYVGVGALEGRGLPTFLLPTTAGTGSEVTPIAILTDTEAKCKVGIVSPMIQPDFALIDPALTDSAPPHVTAATGMDALTHAVESLISKKTNPFTRALSLEATRLILRSLRNATRDGSDTSARDDLAAASTLAGLAFSCSSCLIVHALAYPLGGRYHVPHGQANAMVLAAAMRFNLPECADDFRHLAMAADLPRPDAEGFIAELDSMTDELGIPRSLSSLGVKEEDLAAMAKDAAAIDRLVQPNPRPMNAEDAEGIYRSIY